jgi:CNT family concentrative nucleoside transporter
MLWSLWLCDVALAQQSNFIAYETTLMDRSISLLGIGVMVFLAWLASENRGRISWRPVAWGVGLQLLFGLVILSPAVSGFFYNVVGGAVNQLLAFSQDGAHFLFGSMAPHQILVDGQPTTFVGQISPPVKTFAFWVLPTIIFFSSLMSVLYYLGVMQFIVQGIAWAMVRTMGTSGAESLSAAGNIFVGQTEAPLLVRPYIEKMTRSELMAVMTGGFATVAGGVMGAYVGFLESIPNIAGHLVVASIISAPAALAVAKVMVPETETSLTQGAITGKFEQTSSNVMEAAANGATDGMKLALNVAAMLVAFVALVALLDALVGYAPVTFCEDSVAFGYTCAGQVQGEALSTARILGWVFAPVAFIIGVPWSDASQIGRLLGEKIILTEFIAYLNLGAMINSETPQITERSAIIASYALCGFANFASIGIQLGGIGGIAPKRMGDLASLGMRAMFAGVIAACMTGAVVGLLL